MWSTYFFIQLVTSLLGSAAFAVLFRIRLKHLPVAMLGGGIAYFVYYIINYCFSSVFAAAFIASAVSAIYAEACARFQATRDLRDCVIICGSALMIADAGM